MGLGVGFKKLFYMVRGERGSSKKLIGDMLIEDGRWKCNHKRIEKNCSSYFFTMQFIDRGLLSIVAWNGCHEAMIVS